MSDSSKACAGIHAHAHAVADGGLSKIATVRTRRGRHPDEARIEVLTTRALKEAAAQKASAAGRSLGAIMEGHLVDWLSGAVQSKREKLGRGARRIQGGEIQQQLLVGNNLLIDIHNLLSAAPITETTAAACHELLTQSLIVNGQLIERLTNHDHVPEFL